MSDDQNYGPPEMRALIRAAAEHSVLSLPEALERLREAEAERDRLRAAYDGLLQLLDIRKDERDRLRAAVEETGDTLAQVLANLDMSDDARTLLLDAVEKATAALDTTGITGTRGEADDG